MALADSLASIPGLAGYLAAKQMNEQQGMGDLQRASGAMSLADMLAKRKQQQEYDAAIAGLGPNPSQEQLAGVAAKYVRDPSKVMETQQKSLDRQAAIAAAQAQKEAALAQAKALAEQTAEMKRAAQAETERANRERAAVMRERLAQDKKPPAGYRYTQSGDLEAIPGGPADMKIQGQFNQDTAMRDSMRADLDRLALEANRLLTHPGLAKTTGLMSAVPGVGGTATIPGTDAANFKAGLETLKSQTGFSVLQNMRNNSKTGGALGQVSDMENKLLQANLASLDRAQSEKEFKAALQRIVNYTEGAKDRLNNAYNLKHAGRVAAGAGAPGTPKVLRFDAQGNPIP